MSHSKRSRAVAKTRAYYDKHAGKWASRKTDSFYHEKQFAQFAKLLPKNSRVLDIGCAQGIHVPLFLGIGRHVRYEGVDISKSFLKIAQRRYPQLSFREIDISTTRPTQKATYGGFLAVAVLMHIPYEHWNIAFENIEHSMKPKAIGYLSFPTQHPSGPSHETDPRHFTLLDPQTQRKYMRDRGWKIIKRGVLDGFTVQKNWQWYIVQLP